MSTHTKINLDIDAALLALTDDKAGFVARELLDSLQAIFDDNPDATAITIEVNLIA